MTKEAHPIETPSTTLCVRLGHWFEANATGWGVVAIPIVVFLFAIMAAAHFVIL